MAIPFLNNINLSDNQLLNAKLQITGTAPAAAQGQIYFNSATGFLKPRVHDGSAWLNLLDTTSIINGTYITSTITNNVDLTLDLSAVNGTAVAATRFLSKDNTWDIPVVDNYTSWDLEDSLGNVQSVESGTRVIAVGQTKIDVQISPGVVGQFDISHDLTSRTDTTSAVTANSFTVVNSVTTDSTGHITAIDVKTVTTAVGTLTGVDEGTYISIDNTDPAVPIINALGTDLPYVAAADDSKLVARDVNGYAYVKTPASGDSTTKIATTAFVQAAVTGLLEFKGGFNANTGAIVGGGNLTSGATRVAVAVGDYYVVTVDGDFFGNAATPLTVGDSVIVQTAAAAGASVEGDFIVVQSDTDLATLTTVGIGNVGNAGVGTTTTYSNGTATITNTDKGSSQNIFKNVASSSGTAVADSNNDTLTIVGAGGISTAVSGDTLTITSSNTNSANTYAATITDSVSGTTFNHGLGEDVIVQLYDAVSLETVYADVVRNGNYLNISFSSTPANSIRVLVQKIG